MTVGYVVTGFVETATGSMTVGDTVTVFTMAGWVDTLTGSTTSGCDRIGFTETGLTKIG